MRNLTIATPWMQQAEPLCLEAGLDYIDVIIDQAGAGDPITDAFQRISPAVRWASLLDGTPEEGLLDDEPVLVRLHWSVWQHKDLLAQLLQYWGNDARLMLLISPLSFDVLRNRLSALSQFEWEEQSGLLRFYDPHIFPELVTSVFTADQLASFNTVALYWGWLDRDLNPVWHAGTLIKDNPPPPVVDTVRLDDQQIAIIGSISDAHMISRNTPYPELSHEQNFRLCFEAALKANKEGFIGELSEYIRQQDAENE